MGRQLSLKKDEKGIVSIIVTVILILVMTLIVLGMARNSAREQRQALDRQLSDQAFYNAESGINDWADYLFKNSSSITIPDRKITCQAEGLPAGTFPNPQPDNKIDGPNGANKYTCLLYDKAPQNILISSLSTSESKVMPITPISSGGVALSDLTISWKNSVGSTSISDCNNSPTAALGKDLGVACNVGGLKIDLIDPGNLTRSGLIGNTFSAFFLPNNSPTSVDIPFLSAKGFNGQGAIGVGSCNITDGCTVKITNINLLSGNTLMMHVKSLYNATSLNISGVDIANNKVNFKGVQVEIDSTGKSSDVLRRVKVRIPINNSFDYADNALRTADSICKLINVNKDALPPTADLTGCTAP